MTPDARQALDFAIRHINASAHDPIEPDTLLSALRTEVVPQSCEHHVHAFFDETEIETMSDLVRGGALSYAVLARGARRWLPPAHNTRRWLDERA